MEATGVREGWEEEWATDGERKVHGYKQKQGGH
jgi:hypothetical protein